MSARPYLCPAGFDCAFENACPSLVLPCPEGFFCGSFAGADNDTVATMDLRYAEWKARLGSAAATKANARAEFGELGRVVSVPCFKGFSCTSGNALPTQCPAGTFCPEQGLAPLPCEALSVCNAGAYYQLSPVAAIIALLATVLVVTMAVVQRRRQGTAERASRAAGRPSGPAAETALGEPAAVAKQVGLAFAFRDLAVSMPLPNGGALPVLRAMSGSLPSSTLCAVMGPTACGKSTLLTALRMGGHTPPIRGASLTGTVSVTLGSRRIGDRELRRRIGFVPQEDVLDRTLTVRELLTFNAMARVGKRTAREAAVIVDRTLIDLGLTGVADTIIGGGANAAANISGGQAKRVNIACELVSLNSEGEPGAALLLDEPTSGLDAAIANDLAATLDRLAESGISVCMVVQQPRPEIFARIRHLLLVQDGGIVYEGPSSEAAPYLRSQGFVQSEDTSPADFCVDVLNGLSSRSAAAEGAPLSTVWAARTTRPAVAALPSSDVGGSTFVVTSPLVREADVRSETAAPVAPTSLLDSAFDFVRVCALNAQRSLLTRLRQRSNLLIYGLLHAGMAGALSTGFTVYLQGTYRNTLDPPVLGELVPFCPVVLREYCRSRNQLDLGLAQLLFFMSTALGTAAALSSVPLLGGRSELVRREALSGLSALAYSLGAMTADSLLVVWNGLLFAGVWLLFGHSGSWQRWLGVMLPTAWAASGIGYASSVITRPVNASVVSIIVIVVTCVFAGVEPQLSSVRGLPIVNWAFFLSFATWTAEGTYVTWTSYMTGALRQRMLDGVDHFGYDVAGGQSRSIGILVLIGFVWRAIATALLVRKAR